MLPSLYVSGDKARAWSVPRAAAIGAGIGAAAALVKTLGPLHQAIAAGGGPGAFAAVPEMAGAALGFAVLCAGAAALRNFLARRLIWPEVR